MTKIKNPILTGFHPDPAAVQVGGTFYIANSTFEYFPGVKISKSTNLIDWETAAFPLNEERFLNMSSQDSSSGVWAPCLSYSDGLFYLVYSNIRTFKLEGEEGIPFHDDYNYLITAPSVEGPWSDPIYLTGSGFDTSLFHDDDGRKWLLYAKWSWSKKPGAEEEHSAGFHGIAMQEYSVAKQKLIGSEQIIYYGTERGLVEGPHIYKKDGYYYLLTAEGGTEYNHASTIARSKQLAGPYENRPGNPHLVTSAYNSELKMQKSGHGALMVGPKDDWYLVHLCGRPIKRNQDEAYSRENSFSVLGRETALEPIEWIDGWPYILGGGNEPLTDFKVPYESLNQVKENPSIYYDFLLEDSLEDFSNLRVAMDEAYFTLAERASYLRIKGHDSIVSRYRQSALFRRQQWFTCTVETYMEYEPESFQQLAGILYRYNESNQYYLFSSYDEELKQKYLSLMIFDKGKYSNPISAPIYFDQKGIYLRISVAVDKVSFYYSFNKEDWHQMGGVLDALKMSDEYCWPGFTGAMFGLSAQDFTGNHKHADFDYFEIKHIK